MPNSLEQARICINCCKRMQLTSPKAATANRRQAAKKATTAQARTGYRRLVTSAKWSRESRPPPLQFFLFADFFYPRCEKPLLGEEGLESTRVVFRWLPWDRGPDAAPHWMAT